MQLAEIQIIDTDTHVVEPPDLWTSRMSTKYGTAIPHVRWDDGAAKEMWFIDDTPVGAVGLPAQAGWPEYPPAHPPRWQDIAKPLWEPEARIALMDQYGIYAQLLYPNVALFFQGTLQSKLNLGAMHECIVAYNDWQSEWSSYSPDRLIPVTTVPFWDLDKTLREIDRCAAMGHRGIAFSQEPAAFGLPPLASPHWDPVWASAQEKGLPVNFHIASGDVSLFTSGGGFAEFAGVQASYASFGVSFFLGNARTIANLVCGGICHRFPRLNFVLVESGVGWLPFALASLDWSWLNAGVREEHPEYDLLPSEYFRRQIYGSFWFEDRTAVASVIEQIGDENIMYETDFPHPTSMSPGPASAAVSPPEYVQRTLAGVSDVSLRRILHDNAAALYRIGNRG